MVDSDEMSHSLDISEEDYLALHRITEQMEGVETVQEAIRRLMRESGRADVTLSGEIRPIKSNEHHSSLIWR